MNFNRTYDGRERVWPTTPEGSPLIKNPNEVRAEGVFFNAMPFWMHLHSYDAVDACCYTFDADFCYGLPLRRVVCCKLKGDPRPAKVRTGVNVHAKLYLCYNAGRLKNVFCGSWNLVRPTFLEVVALVAPGNSENARRWFAEVWKQGRPYKAR